MQDRRGNTMFSLKSIGVGMMIVGGFCALITTSSPISDDVQLFLFLGGLALWFINMSKGGD
jgi:hypothetical protein